MQNDNLTDDSSDSENSDSDDEEGKLNWLKCGTKWWFAHDSKLYE